jgi:hypothetical protein
LLRLEIQLPDHLRIDKLDIDVGAQRRKKTEDNFRHATHI